MEVIINVSGIKTWSRHGVYENERISGRYFLTDVQVKAEVDAQAILHDDLSATVNYELINDIVLEKMAVPVRLLEKLAAEIADAIKKADSRIVEVKVIVTKLCPPLFGEVGSTSVEIKL
jgi:7,8-dihydroneopterin aldolase/epimerase/oxygenase